MAKTMTVNVDADDDDDADGKMKYPLFEVDPHHLKGKFKINNNG